MKIKKQNWVLGLELSPVGCHMWKGITPDWKPLSAFTVWPNGHLKNALCINITSKTLYKNKSI